MPSLIVIERLECEGRCGVSEQERQRPQRLAVDVELEVPTEAAGETDDLARTIDYAAVTQRVVSLVAQERCRLLEHLAERIVAMLFADFPTDRVRLWLRKLAAPMTTITASVGVRIERTRSARSSSTDDPDPAAFLIDHLETLPKGTVLDVASGAGRNALFLLRHGMAVDAVDRDEAALGKLEAAARAKALSGLTVRRLDLEEDPEHPPALGRELYDGIIVFFYLFRPLFTSIVQALKPGGILLYETFLIDNYFRHRHPRRWEFCLAHNELLRLTSPLRVLHYDEGEHVGGPGSASAFTARLVAQKPQTPRHHESH